MSSERAEQPTTPDNQHGIPGKTLAAHREAMGWSVEQVADQLKLAVRQVVALEAGDYAALPSPAVTRGFVRAYAKLMKLDPAPLVAQIEMDTPPAADLSATNAATRRPTPASFSESRFPLHSKRSTLPLGWIAGAVVVVAAAAAAWHFGVIPSQRGAEPAIVTAPAATGAAADAASAGSAPGSAVETLQNPAVPLISVPSPNAAPAAGASSTAAPAPGPVVNVPSVSATGAPPSTVPAAPANPVTTQAPPPVAAAAAAAQAANSGANALVLSVRQDSWIEVRPAAGGAPLLSRLVKAGSTETVNVAGPVRLTVGNPGGVSATLRGNAVALPAVPGKTLARVNLQ